MNHKTIICPICYSYINNGKEIIPLSIKQESLDENERHEFSTDIYYEEGSVVNLSGKIDSVQSHDKFNKIHIALGCNSFITVIDYSLSDLKCGNVSLMGLQFSVYNGEPVLVIGD